ncbi:MAG: DNA adenine methylase [Spirochaetes bacterium]|nr:DNA adenine methylase [Spirochaetota bacterium]MBU1080301.1 DNA adenine methylase [Spirochaetota bacterium]
MSPRPSALPGPEGYCSSQLIPYLGNKRSLLPRLRPVFEELAAGRPGLRFLDPFAGSGSVSRLARAMGMDVAANDWEPYSEALSACWLALRPSDIDYAFGGPSGLGAFLSEWNGMHPSVPGGVSSPYTRPEPYIARWYAPRDTASPRIGEERLFYTAENAAFIDYVRSRIESEYGGAEPGSPEDIRRRVALGGILLEAAVHSNTSGVFKAYHKGFGGHGKDALTRILGRMELEPPILPEATPARVYREDARRFVSRQSADIAYFDPPYNQHQYGSNYHLLNTILRWDGLPMPTGPGNADSLSPKAGIPVGWKETRSAFCVKKEASSSISATLDSCDAARLVFSWNADGHLSGDDLVGILAPRGRLDVLALDYVSYRGGRQSASRSSRSREYLFVVDTRAAPCDEAAARQVLRELAARDEALRSSYDPARVAAAFGIGFGSGSRIKDEGSGSVEFPGAESFFEPDLRRPSSAAPDIVEAMGPEARARFLEVSATCACANVVEDLDALSAMARSALERADTACARKAARESIRLIRKLAHDKYSGQFFAFIAGFGSIARELGDDRIAAELRKLESLMGLRICEEEDAL